LPYQGLPKLAQQFSSRRSVQIVVFVGGRLRGSGRLKRTLTAMLELQRPGEGDDVGDGGRAGLESIGTTRPDDPARSDQASRASTGFSRDPFGQCLAKNSHGPHSQRQSDVLA
jgi:hypothetical protein